jgi:hypothetical protein
VAEVAAIRDRWLARLAAGVTERVTDPVAPAPMAAR